MNALIVVASAVLMRMVPVIFGLVVARTLGAHGYADFVLALSLLNITASIFQLGVVPQIIRSDADSEWGVFLSRATLGTVLLFIPSAAVLFYVDNVLWSNLAISALAIGSVFGLLAASIASALLCRAGSFVKLLKQSIAFFLLAILPVLAAALQDLRNQNAAWIAGAWVAALGLIWLALVIRVQMGSGPKARATPSMWARFRSDAFHSAAFGVVMSFGFYIANKNAVHVEDIEARAAIALGFQALAIVLFIPSALSSYLVPKLKARQGQVRERNFIAQSAAWYFALAAVSAIAIVAMKPVLERLYSLPLEGSGLLAFYLLMGSAVLAATNAIFNQVLVAAGRFVRQLLLALLWLIALVTGLWKLAGHPTGPAVALILAYAVLLGASAAHIWLGGVLSAGAITRNAK